MDRTILDSVCQLRSGDRACLIPRPFPPPELIYVLQVIKYWWWEKEAIRTNTYVRTLCIVHVAHAIVHGCYLVHALVQSLVLSSLNYIPSVQGKLHGGGKFSDPV